jgi:hypothetical protein
MFIPDPDFPLIPDPGVKKSQKAPDPDLHHCFKLQFVVIPDGQLFLPKIGFK